MKCFTAFTDSATEGIAVQREPYEHVFLGYTRPGRKLVRIPIDMRLSVHVCGDVVYNATVMRVENGPLFLTEEQEPNDTRALVLVRIHGNRFGVRYELPRKNWTYEEQNLICFPPDGTEMAGVLPLASAYTVHYEGRKRIPYETKLVVLEKGAQFVVTRPCTSCGALRSRIVTWDGTQVKVRTWSQLHKEECQ